MNNNNIIFKYLSLKLPQSSNLTPRIGFYAIQDIEIVKGKYGQDIIAKAVWSEDYLFNTCMEFSVKLNSLKSSMSEGPISLTYEQLLDMVIQIKSIELISTIDRYGVPRKSYKVIWEVICHEDVILKLTLNEDQLYSKYLESELDLICYESEENIILTLENEASLDYYQNLAIEEDSEGMLIDEMNRQDANGSDI
ncbi:MAG: hypothetical protein EOO42_16090 [Flavobacteriales bacterium]|nr:MAG: hypothetical protein EOO42_16090 [Flavobacteriales bacterium]